MEKKTQKQGKPSKKWIKYEFPEIEDPTALAYYANKKLSHNSDMQICPNYNQIFEKKAGIADIIKMGSAGYTTMPDIKMEPDESLFDPSALNVSNIPLTAKATESTFTTSSNSSAKQLYEIFGEKTGIAAIEKMKSAGYTTMPDIQIEPNESLFDLTALNVSSIPSTGQTTAGTFTTSSNSSTKLQNETHKLSKNTPLSLSAQLANMKAQILEMKSKLESDFQNKDIEWNQSKLLTVELNVLTIELEAYKLILKFEMKRQAKELAMYTKQYEEAKASRDLAFKKAEL